MLFLRINMTTRHIHTEDVPADFIGLGGRGLTSKIINLEVPACCDPLGPDNRLIFAPGFLTGTPLVNTGRLSIGSKSPLTGGIKESNVGGTMSTALARQGLKAIIIEGKADDGTLFFLKINADSSVELVDAANYKGMRNYALAETLLAEYGDKFSISSIGPAGELKLASASIQTTDTNGKPSRSAGRGGLGAVMGAKGLKALIVSKEGKYKKVIADRTSFKEVSKQFASSIKTNGWSGKVLPELGTAGIVSGVNASGALPSFNARKGCFAGAEHISGETMAKTINQRGGKTTHKGCSQCIISCSNIYVDEAGKPITSALEYETLWAMGAMIGNSNLDAVARLDFLCDDIGLDTMNTGTAIAVAMDAGYKSFGDAAAAIEMVEEVAKGTELGSIIGNGPDAAGKHFNNPRVPAVKRQSIAGYDPRAMQGMGVTYATSPMGADHTAGFVGGGGSSTAELISASQSAQIHMAAFDSMGLCFFAQSGGLNNVFKAISAITGKPFGNREWEDLGINCLKAETRFNSGAGLTQEDDRLPSMFHDENLLPYHKYLPYKSEDLGDVMAPFKQS
ncbi:MAG: aldehyde ferredoxin oxidoreductase [Desulfobacterales bacterium]|nr:aldehyde ferredoxin oxidoreductase [Desulfobacterales bacterium]